MEYQQKRTWAEVNLGNIAGNVRALRETLPPDCGFVGIVKADAYGHGAVPVARRLAELGAAYLAVSCIDEALELRSAGIRETPILILGPSPAFLARELAENRLTQTVCDAENARALSETLAGSDLTLRIHVKVDTGMGRLGLHAGEAGVSEKVAAIAALPHLEAEGIFTHFAASDEAEDGFTAAQHSLFLRAVSGAEALMGRRFALRHCANSGAVVNYRQMAMDLARPGIALYGAYHGFGRDKIALRPAMSLKTRVSFISRHYPGDTISYGRTYPVAQEGLYAVLPIGYADGLHRSLSGNMDVLLHGKRAPLRGRICMDLCVVDITHIPECRVGDIATVFGTDGHAVLGVDELAERAGTISYELLCSVSKRVPRIYLD